MDYICKNCGNSFNGNFCNECGQSSHIHPVNLSFIWHDLQHGLFHFDKGIIYTLLQLFIRPGGTIKGFIEGRRTRYFPPVSLVVVMATLYGLLYHLLHINTFKYTTTKDYNEFNEWLGAHYALFTLITIPYYAFFSYLFFKKHHYSFSEHIVLNSYLASQRLCVSVLSIPFLYYAGSAGQVSLISSVLVIIDLGLAYRAFSQFFTMMPRWKSFLVTNACYVVTILVMSICLALILNLVER